MGWPIRPGSRLGKKFMASGRELRAEPPRPPPPADEAELIAACGFVKGDVVDIVDGPHEGLTGRVGWVGCWSGEVSLGVANPKLGPNAELVFAKAEDCRLAQSLL